ncbi:hypothetical protein [Nocardioides sp. zg-DK7169]|uniref:hypothetical protein n=1 Tax=Nocardioides sp. zg-DK7169 TaxID=2736600 RepID=UPI0015561117|nr:hypothetical protein [Nocardioides sp. zg-DK7169]NPC96524.1 hypothetical protein [Nocardioides sp. zg-DK7169]
MDHTHGSGTTTTRLGAIASAPVILALLATGLTLATPGPAHAHRADWGKIARPDGVLRRGCHDYAYRYRFTPPDGDWAVETFLIGPGGRPLASDVLMSGHDETRGRTWFRLCRTGTRPGRFRIKGKMTIQNGPLEAESGWVLPARFRLRRP